MVRQISIRQAVSANCMIELAECRKKDNAGLPGIPIGLAGLKLTAICFGSKIK